MNAKYKDYIVLAIWVILFIAIGKVIGMLSTDDVDTWYVALQRSPLTPPNYIFGIVWTFLYAIIAVVGWLIWRSKVSKGLLSLKLLYVAQLILNWSWTTLFFEYHYTGISLISLFFITSLVSVLIIRSYKLIPLVSLLLTPYVCWLLFATYLNFYIWYYN